MNPLLKKLHPDFIEQVKERADILEVVSAFTTLVKQGKEYMGACPFHQENTPSFTVTPSKNLFYCFGCSLGGNAINFLMEVGQVSFTDAVLDLARSNNIPIVYEDGSSDRNYQVSIPRPQAPIKASPADKQPQSDKDYTVDEWRVNRSVERLLSGTGDAALALGWLQQRGITREMVKRYRLGLEKRVVKPSESRSDYKEEYSSVAIFIPVPNRPGRFYVKKRVCPWLTDDERPKYLAKWSQFGVPAVIWFTYTPPDANETWFTEGEWDAILLGFLARVRGEKVAVACSTAGSNTVPKPEELERLPGQVTIFYDRDEAGEKGAQKLAAALGKRGWIGSVPMPDDCQTKGWDVSNAILSGYAWEDFEAAPVTEPEQKNEVTPPNEQGIRFRVLRKSLDQLLEIFPELETEAGKNWLKMRQFTPDHTIDSQYFDWSSDKPGVNLAVNSGLGTGKTYHVHNKFLADDGIGAVALGYRNALLIQFTDRGKKWYHLQKDLKQSKEEMNLLSDSHSRISGCVDSLIYFQGYQFSDKRLVLDEIEGTFKHLYESKTAVSFHRQVCKERMGEAIANSEATILLDGNLTDLTVAHAERISGKKFTKIKNSYQGNRGKLTYYTGTLKVIRDEETGELVVAERKVNDYSLLQKVMLDDADNFVVGSDSQEKLQAWDDILKAKGVRTFRLDGTNSNSPEAKKFLADPAKYILENQIQAILYSPTGESGLSIDLVGYFKRSYFFFFGVVSTNEQFQFIGRPRDPNIHIHVYCQVQGQKSGGAELVSDDLQRFFVEYTLECSRISLTDVGEQERQQKILQLATDLVHRSNDAHFQYECHLQAREVFEHNHLRKCLEYALRTAGYQVETVTGYQVSKKETEIAQEAVQLKKSKELFKATALTPEQANEKLRKFDATYQDKVEVARHRLLSRLPGIESKTVTNTTVVTVPAESVKEIQSGRLSKEIAQLLGIPMSEIPSTKGVYAVHLPQNFSINQGEGGQLPGSGDDYLHGGGQVENLGQETAQNSGVASSETSSTQVPDAVHLPPNFCINQGEGGQLPGEGEVELVVTQTKPIFDPEFIRKVKFQNRALISQIELHFLLEHPDIAKLLQQRRWYKKLKVFSDPNEPDCLKRLNLTTYNSDWLKVHTLLEMGIGYFLSPESQWTQDSPEAKAFWEKGKDSRTARYIGTSVGDSKPCEYIGRVLSKLDVKTKSQKVKTDTGERIRVYRVNTDYLQNPVRQAIYECVGQRIKDGVKEDAIALDWDVIIHNHWSKETAQNPEVATASTPFTQASEGVHLPQNSLNNQGEGVPTTEGGATELEKLIDTLAGVNSPEQFWRVARAYSAEMIEDAILFQKLDIRYLLRAWYEVGHLTEDTAVELPLSGKPSIEVAENTSVRPPLTAYKEGQEVWAYFPQSEKKWLRATVEWVRGRTIRVVNGFFGMFVECPDMIAPGDWVLT